MPKVSQVGQLGVVFSAIPLYTLVALCCTEILLRPKLLNSRFRGRSSAKMHEIFCNLDLRCCASNLFQDPSCPLRSFQTPGTERASLADERASLCGSEWLSKSNSPWMTRFSTTNRWFSTSSIGDSECHTKSFAFQSTNPVGELMALYYWLVD